MKFSYMTAVGAAFFLSACGGSGTGEMIEQTPISDLIARATAFESEVGKIDSDDIMLSPDSALQSTGFADFTGVAFVSRENATDPEITDFAAIGSTTLRVNFEAGTVAGTADNFYQVDDTETESFAALTGSLIAGSMNYDLSLSEGEDNYYEGRLAGSLTETSGNTIDIDLPAEGGLVGETAQSFALATDGEESLTNVAIVTLKD